MGDNQRKPDGYVVMRQEDDGPPELHWNRTFDTLATASAYADRARQPSVAGHTDGYLYFVGAVFEVAPVACCCEGERRCTGARLGMDHCSAASCPGDQTCMTPVCLFPAQERPKP